ncbi:hypothetical protein [Arthrobacter sp. ZGTC131]|jgi:hypothetical protein|uniref:hypothetical protein n=1 Tax=Arthrobacter sp. ZGTC131 TaxID=2058898 RepID=UPI000CE33515|nr:hypothetical protein [Arthrobacter sp. ZGTC131]
MPEKDLTNEFSARTVHVTVPAEVAFNLDRIQTVQKEILGRLGCSACCSGFDIRFDIARRFVVDTDLQVQPAGLLE